MKPPLLRLHLAALLLATAACGARETAPSEPDVTEPVHAAAPAVAPVAPEFVGVISSRVSKVITADFEGSVETLPIHNGQTVKQGEVVATLDDTELKHKLDQAKGAQASAKGNLARAGAAYSNARRQATMERRLIRSGAAAPEAYRNALSQAGQYGADGAAAKGELERAQAQIDEVVGLLAKANVKSPLEGVISDVKVKEGQLARKGEPIARVFDPDQLVVRFAVPRSEINLFKLGTTVELVTEDNRVVPASVRTKDDDHDPSIDYTVFEAVIDPNFRIDEIRVGDNGHVRIAGAVR